MLVAEDLAPADTAGLDPTLVIALATSLGGPTSHTAIIARQLGIPCVVAADVDDIAVGTVVLVNGGNGNVVIDPDLDEAQALIEVDKLTRAAAAAYAGPGQTLGRRRDLGLRQRPGRPVGAEGRADRGRGRRPVPQRAGLPRPRHRADRRGAGRGVRRGVRGVRRAQGRHPHARRGLRQADEVRDSARRAQPGARRARPAPVVEQPRPDDSPARRHRPGRRRPPAPRRG